MGPLDIVVRLILGCFIGSGIGLTGVGGGVLVLPSLAMLGLPTVACIGTASAYSVLTMGYALVEHIRLKTIDYRAVLLFLASAAPATTLTAVLVKAQAQNAGFQHGLSGFIIGIIALSGVLMIINLLHKRKQVTQIAAATADPETETETPPAASAPRGLARALIGVVLGVVVGGIMAASSVSGGVIVIPILIFAFHLPISRTAGSSIFIIIALMALAALIYHFVPAGSGGKSQVAVGTAAWMAVGSIAGVSIGSRLTTRLSDQALQGAIIAMITLALLGMTWKTVAG
ncbi:MAG: sulfite exporter TauE/SafE family protein [Planctomycetota bacterium]